MDRRFFVSGQRISGTFLILSNVVVLIAINFFVIRVIWEWPVGVTLTYYRWERSLVIAALLTALLGFTLLKSVLEIGGDSIFVPMGLVLF